MVRTREFNVTYYVCCDIESIASYDLHNERYRGHDRIQCTGLGNYPHDVVQLRLFTGRACRRTVRRNVSSVLPIHLPDAIDEQS